MRFAMRRRKGGRQRSAGSGHSSSPRSWACRPLETRRRRMRSSRLRTRRPMISSTRSRATQVPDHVRRCDHGQCRYGLPQNSVQCGTAVEPVAWVRGCQPLLQCLVDSPNHPIGCCRAAHRRYSSQVLSSGANPGSFAGGACQAIKVAQACGFVALTGLIVVYGYDTLRLVDSTNIGTINRDEAEFNLIRFWALGGASIIWLVLIAAALV